MSTNLNLLRCALNRHKYDNLIRDDTLNRTVRICKYCGNQDIVIKDNRLRQYELDKELIIDTIKSERWAHAKRLIDEMMVKLGYS